MLEERAQACPSPGIDVARPGHATIEVRSEVRVVGSVLCLRVVARERSLAEIHVDRLHR